MKFTFYVITFFLLNDNNHRYNLILRWKNCKEDNSISLERGTYVCLWRNHYDKDKDLGPEFLTT